MKSGSSLGKTPASVQHLLLRYFCPYLKSQHCESVRVSPKGIAQPLTLARHRSAIGKLKSHLPK